MKKKIKMIGFLLVILLLLSGKYHIQSSDSSFIKDVREQIYFTQGVSVLITDQMFIPPYKDDPERMLHSFEREKTYALISFYRKRGKERQRYSR